MLFYPAMIKYFMHLDFKSYLNPESWSGFELFESQILTKLLVYRSLSFFLTDNGIVLKIITIYNQETESMEEVILEELQIFKVFLFKKIYVSIYIGM